MKLRALAPLLLCASAFLCFAGSADGIEVFFKKEPAVDIPPSQYDSIATTRVEIEGKRWKAILLKDLLSYAHVRGERVFLRGETEGIVLSWDAANSPGLFVYFTRAGNAKIYDSTSSMQDISFPGRLERIEVFPAKNYFSPGWILTWTVLLFVAVLLLWRRETLFARSVFVFLGTLLVYENVHVPSNGNISDNYWYVPTSLSLLKEGNLELSEYTKLLEKHESGTRRVRGKYYMLFPVGTPLLAMPFVFAATRVYEDVPSLQARMYRIAAFSAKLIAALSVALLFLLLVRLTGNLRQSLFLSALFALATSHFGLHAGGLWSHNAVLPLLLAALLLVTAQNEKIRWLAALPLAMAYVTRPTYAVHILLMSGYVFVYERKSFVRYVLLGFGVAALFVLFSLQIYGHFLPPYYSQGRILFRNFFQALAANVVSPNRGLFIFTPIFLGSVYGMYTAFRYPTKVSPLFRLFSIMAIAHWMIVSTTRNWWAGATVGPRYFCDVLPILILLLIPAREGLGQNPVKVRRILYFMFSVFVAWSLFVQYRTVTSMELIRWNSFPAGLKQHPERIWDWNDMQIFRSSSPVRNETPEAQEQGEDF